MPLYLTFLQAALATCGEQVMQIIPLGDDHEVILLSHVVSVTATLVAKLQNFFQHIHAIMVHLIFFF